MRSLSSSQSDIVFLYLINMFNPTIFQESCVAWLSGLPHFGIGIGYKQNVSYCHWAPAKAAKNRKHGPKVQSVTWARWDLRFGFYGWLFPYDIIRSSRFGNWTKYKEPLPSLFWAQAALTHSIAFKNRSQRVWCWLPSFSWAALSQCYSMGFPYISCMHKIYGTAFFAHHSA